MFGRKKKQPKQILSPVDGKAIPITQVSDRVFSEKILGDGVAIRPSEGTFFAPCDGEITQIAHTNHAICITTEFGAEILIHIGMDTLNLEGKGFKPYVKAGDKVSTGDKLMEVDLLVLKADDYNIDSPVIITNTDCLQEVEFLTGDVIHCESPIIKYKV